MSRAVAHPAFYAAESAVFARYSLQPRSQLIPLRDPELRIRVLEAGSGEPVLLLHGFSLGTALWASLLARLPTFRCIAIDLPGHGGSDSVDFDRIDLRRWFTTMLTACLDRLGLDAVHVVGHSQGAMLGLFLALDAPERVHSLVAIGTPAVAFGAQLPGLRVLAQRGIGPLLLGMPKPRAMYRRILADTMGEHGLAAIPADLVRAMYLGTQRHGYGQTVSTYLREMFRGADASPPRYVLSDAELARIQRPVTVLWGRDDRRFQDPADARKRAARISNARFEVVPGGHVPWLDELDSCVNVIAAFRSMREGAELDQLPKRARLGGG